MPERFSELRFASLISGGGSTFEAMARATKENGELHGIATPAVVISSKKGVAGLKKAEELGIPTELVIRKDYETTESYNDALIQALDKHSPDVITLNGFLVKISENLIDKYADGIFNQHPGPVPEFGGPGMYGRRVHAAVLLFARKTKMHEPFTEAIAQRVDPEFDAGAVVKSRRVDIYNSDTVDDLQERVLPVEHQVQIELLKDVANGVLQELSNRHLFASTDTEIHSLQEAKAAAKLLYPNG